MKHRFSRFSLDVIGKAGFGEDFGAIHRLDHGFTEALMLLSQAEPIHFGLQRFLIEPLLRYWASSVRASW
jgi:hypothetical protein